MIGKRPGKLSGVFFWVAMRSGGSTAANRKAFGVLQKYAEKCETELARTGVVLGFCNYFQA